MRSPKPGSGWPSSNSQTRTSQRRNRPCESVVARRVGLARFWSPAGCVDHVDVGICDRSTRAVNQAAPKKAAARLVVAGIDRMKHLLG